MKQIAAVTAALCSRALEVISPAHLAWRFTCVLILILVFPPLPLLGCNQLLDESQVTLSFQDWLASVTERIHQTMHYQFEGKASGMTPFWALPRSLSKFLAALNHH